MSVSLPRWTRITMVWFFVIGLTYSASIRKDITCYVCTPNPISDNTEASEISITFSNYDIETIPTCGSNSAVNFTLKCPEGYKGCLTKTYGKSILKSCNEYPITDCKIANNVKYCFCANNLCNDATILTPIPISTDDEDLDQTSEDGSGLFDDLTQLDKHKYTKKIINTTVILNTPIKNNSFTKASADKLLLHKHIYILSLIFITYKAV
ncbi:uncharacterized protein LOC114119942 isoform X2 [Aphis gossypii]|uniref:uncharacterized protein LOC114119942 isoform X2 n=1 Tax=Aphis gossypii TaxID=80765 RepID=UPI0021590F82|nr:uncharacterized protein LOC114119942 isoform X2 [Aphis gossypii]